jgi:hypothetical protein
VFEYLSAAKMRNYFQAPTTKKAEGMTSALLLRQGLK